MKLAVQCKGCSSRYAVDARHAGARVRCKKCGEAIRVPSAPAPARAADPAGDGPDIFALADLARSMGAPEEEQSPAVEAGQSPAARPSYVGSQPTEMAVAPASRPELGAWLRWSLDLVRRYAPRRWWVWALAAVVMLVVAGLLSTVMALATFYILGVAGLLLLVIAAVWGGALALVNGGRVMKGAVTGVAVGSPLLILLIVGLKLVKHGPELKRHAAAPGTPSIDTTTLLLALTFMLVTALMIVGFAANMRAMLGPMTAFGCGIVLVVLSVVPMVVHAAIKVRANPTDGWSLRSAASPAPAGSGGAPRDISGQVGAPAMVRDHGPAGRRPAHAGRNVTGNGMRLTGGVR